MRVTKTSGWTVPEPSSALTRALRLAVVALGIGLVMTAGPARAEDDEDDDSTIEQKIIGGIMAGIGGTNMENRGIEYRERSPLVVPPKLDLPPPSAGASAAKLANWPKDPDESRRKAAIEARKKVAKGSAFDPHYLPLTPAQLAAGKTAAPARTGNEPVQPGFGSAQKTLSPDQLGYTGTLWGTMFGGSKAEIAPFQGEPTRQSLTQPPSGYQTPSPNFAYGTGPQESLNKEYNPAKGLHAQ